MKQEIAFSRGLVIVPTGASKGNKTQVLTCAAEIARLGYILDMQAIDRMMHLSTNELRAFTTGLVKMIRGKIGADIAYVPFYRNFPEDVMEMSHLELFINAIVHYMSNGTWEPAQELQRRGPFTEKVEMAKLLYVSDSDFRNIFTAMVGANQSLSPFNKRAVEWFIKNDKENLRMPAKVPFRETMALLAVHGCDVPVRFETDVLRIALAMSGVDPAILPIPANAALALEHRFKKFSRPERKYVLNLLEGTNPQATNLQTHKNRWIRLGEILHVGEYANAFPQSFAAFKAIRNQKKVKVRTFASNLDYAMKIGDGAAAMSLLCSRPGEFARRIDALMRKFNADDVLTSFSTVADRVSSKVLCELVEHMMNRTEVTVRSVLAKGSRSAAAIETLEALDPALVGRAVGILQTAMMYGMAKLPPMGKVYIDPELKKLALVKGARTLSDTVRAVPRGTRIKLDADANVLRAFVHWYDENGREDIDLSVALYSSNFTMIDQVSFTNLKTNGVYHSGDIRHRQGSCAEYVDIDLNAVKHRGIQYASLLCYNYNGRPLNSIKQCFIGFMSRVSPKSGEIFEPKTVKNVMASESGSMSVLPCVFDLVKGECIWVDLDLNTRYLDSNDSQIVENMISLVKEPNMSMFDLINLHVQARGGKIVDSAEKADEVYDFPTLSLDAGKATALATW